MEIPESVKLYREKKKQYREAHKDHIQEKSKHYYEVNKEIIKEKKKQYYEENKELMTAKITCECDSIVNKNDIAKHRKTKKHETKMNRICENCGITWREFQKRNIQHEKCECGTEIYKKISQSKIINL